MRVEIDIRRINKISPRVSDIVKSMELESFTNPEYYPPEDAPTELVVMYFLVMVAMDHRLSRRERPYEAVINGKVYHGADLLYRLGAQMLRSRPEFFSAGFLAKIAEGEVKRWLTVKSGLQVVASPPDVNIRVKLLRDLGEKLTRIYDGNPMRLIEGSNGYLRKGVGEGLIDRLKVFIAYQDPVEKKGFLLAKFLERRGVFPVKDEHNKEVPVDNHLMRIALRLGIVKVDSTTLDRIKRGEEMSEQEDIILRYAARRAYKIMCSASGIDPFILDDFLWSFGRRFCTRVAPACQAGKACFLSDVCSAFTGEIPFVSEHSFTETWWY